ncbi:MFS transporter [Clostridium estertheticum]|uniref:MFS transporter n=1 Tax=Clostridium estertheticum TaxID=238834 RepID=UPI0013E927C0|nr:MFS transporter [Clostridium estertheticum]MBZ9686306.1 MFS transporter [Clostridium estertheticum]
MDLIKKIYSPYQGLPKEIYIIFISRIINTMGCFVQPLLVLILTQKIGLQKDVAGIYITVVCLISAPCLILGGKLVDTIGRKKVILISQGFGAITLICCGFIKPNIMMIYILMLSSVLYSLSTPAYDALLADLTTPENRKTSYSLVYMGWNLGFVIGPLIGGMLFKNYLSLVFIGDGITTVLSLALVMIYVKETIVEEMDLTQENRQQEKRVEGSVFSVLLSRPILLFFSLILCCYSFEYSQWGFTLPLQLGEIYKNLGAFNYGILAAVNGAIVILITPLILKITFSVKPIRAISIGGLFYAIAFGMFAVTKIFSLFLFFTIIMTLGEIMININASTFIANHTPSSHRGRISAILPIISGAGYAFGPITMGKIITKYSISSGWIIIGILGLISAFMMFLIERMDKDIVSD